MTRLSKRLNPQDIQFSRLIDDCLMLIKRTGLQNFQEFDLLTDDYPRLYQTDEGKDSSLEHWYRERYKAYEEAQEKLLSMVVKYYYPDAIPEAMPRLLSVNLRDLILLVLAMEPVKHRNHYALKSFIDGFVPQKG